MLSTGTGTAATRRLAPEPATPVSPQPVAPPRRAPARPTPRPVIAPADARAKPSAFGRFARGVGLLLLIAILAAVIAGAVLLLTNAGQNTGIGEFIKQNLNDQIQSIEDFIRAHTQ
jgi:hypothetical protein